MRAFLLFLVVSLYSCNREYVVVESNPNSSRLILEKSNTSGFNFQHSLSIGRKSSPAYDAWKGAIDDIRIYNRALNAKLIIGLRLLMDRIRYMLGM